MNIDARNQVCYLSIIWYNGKLVLHYEYISTRVSYFEYTIILYYVYNNLEIHYKYIPNYKIIFTCLYEVRKDYN